MIFLGYVEPFKRLIAAVLGLLIAGFSLALCYAVLMLGGLIALSPFYLLWRLFQ